MRISLVSVLFLFNGILFAQKSQMAVDSLAEKNNVIDLYIAPGYVVSKFIDTGTSFASIHMGLVFFDRVGLDVSYGLLLDNFRRQLIFPSYHKYNQKDISIFLQYNLTKWIIRPTAGIGYHRSLASWEPESEAGDKFQDHINQFEIFAGVCYKVTGAIAVELNCGYKISGDVELVSLEDNSFDGLIFRAMVKVGLTKF